MFQIKSIKHFLRFNDWWNFVVPPCLSFIYLLIYFKSISFNDSAVYIALLLISIIGTAGYGYFVNDVCDIEFDRLAGKRNMASKLNVFIRSIIIILLLVIAFAPWLFLPLNYFNFGLFIFQLLLLTIYSVKPIRLKQFIYQGALTDALYNGTVFFLILISVFNMMNENKIQYYNLFLINVFFWGLFKGIRNILLHQLKDRKNDNKANTPTLVLHLKPVRTVYIIDFIVLPIEFILFTLLIILISLHINYYYLWFIAFILFTLIKFSFWKLPKLSYRQSLFKFLYFMNDFYEEWMPVITLTYLSFIDIHFIIILIVHLAIFPRGIMKFYKDINVIIKR